MQGRWPAIAKAAGLVSSPPLRNAGTIGGNLCVDTRCTYYNQTEFWRASIGYCMKKDGTICLVAPGSDKCWALSRSDTAPVMIALGAEVTLVGPRRRAAHPGPAALRPRRHRVPGEAARRDPDRDPRPGPRRLGDDVPQAAPARLDRLPDPGRRGGGEALDAGGVVEDARIVLGAVHTHPVEAHGRAGVPEGQACSTPRRSRWRRASPTSRRGRSTTRTSSYAWRKRMARIEVGRALRELAGLPTGDLPPVVA